MAPPNPDPRGLTWDTWTDFSPGIISQAKFAYGSADNAAPVPYKGPSVAAQPDGTFGCIALPNGGLGPMPGPSGTLTGPSDAFQNGVDNWITGVLVYGIIEGGEGASPGDELLFCIDSVNGSSLRQQAICTLQTGGAWNRVIDIHTGNSFDNPDSVYGFSAVLTMVNADDSTGETTGTAVVAMTTAFINDLSDTGANGRLYLYPDPTNPSVSSPPFYKDYSSDLPGEDGQTGIIFGHQGRIVIFQQNDYLWTGSEVLGGPYDQIYYTDPANTVPGNGNPDSLAQDVVFVQEWPVGAGAWGSVSAGELFVVKHRGGGYIVSGDLNEPTVTFLAGVTPAYGTTRACQTPMGLFYLSVNNGCWLWNGSNVSQKISNQLNDDFFRSANPLPIIGAQYDCFSWVDMVVTSNNWIYDTVTGGWWRLDDVAVSYTWYGSSWDSDTLYCFPSMVTEDTDPICYTYSKVAPANTFQWKSYPMPRSLFKSIVVREVVVRAQGVGTITVVLQGTGGTTDTTVPIDVTINSADQPVYLRFDTGIEAQDVTIKLTSTGSDSGPAPVIYGISSGIVETTLVGPT